MVDKYNQVFSGLVNYEGKHKVKFKENKESDVEVLGIEDIKAFSIESDSFVNVHFQDYISEVKIDRFSKVRLTGPEDLIVKETATEIVEKPTWKYQNTPDGTVPFFSNTRKETVVLYLFQHKGSFYQISKESFYIDMPKIIYDHEALCKMIISKTLTFKDMDKIIEEYETWRKLKITSKTIISR